jgi:hypothetical protein
VLICVDFPSNLSKSSNVCCHWLPFSQTSAVLEQLSLPMKPKQQAKGG